MSVGASLPARGGGGSISALLASTLSPPFQASLTRAPRAPQPTQVHDPRPIDNVSTADPALLASWRAQAEARENKIRAASTRAVTPSQQQQQQHAPTPADTAAATPQPDRTVNNDERTHTSHLLSASRSAAAAAAAATSSLANSVASPTSTHHERALAEHERTRARMEQQLARHRAYLSGMDTSAAAAAPASSPEEEHGGNTSPWRQSAADTVAQYHARVSSPAPAMRTPSPFMASTSPSPAVDDNQSVSASTPASLDDGGPSRDASPVQSRRQTLRSSTGSNDDRHTRNRSRDSTNSFGYDEFELSDNVYMLSEKYPSRHSRRGTMSNESSRRTSLRTSAPGSPALPTRHVAFEQDLVEHVPNPLPPHAASYEHVNHAMPPVGAAASSPVEATANGRTGTSADEALKAAWRSEMDAFLAGILPPDPSLGWQPHAQQQQHHQQQAQLPQTHYYQQPHQHQLASTQPLPYQSNSAHPAGDSASHFASEDTHLNTSLNTSAISGHYLPAHLTAQALGVHGHPGSAGPGSDNAGPDLFALAQAGLQLDSQRTVVEEVVRHQQQQEEEEAEAAEEARSRSDTANETRHHQTNARRDITDHAPPPSIEPSSAFHCDNAVAQHAASQPRRMPSSQSARSPFPQPSRRASSTPPSPPLSSHPSARIDAADLYDANLSVQTNLRFTQQVREDQYRPAGYAPKPAGWTPADSAAAAASRIKKAKSSATIAEASSLSSSRAPTKPHSSTSDAARRPASAQAKVPVLSVTSGPVPVVVAKVHAASNSFAAQQQHRAQTIAAANASAPSSASAAASLRKQARVYPAAKPIPREDHFSQAYAANMSPEAPRPPRDSTTLAHSHSSSFDHDTDANENDEQQPTHILEHSPPRHRPARATQTQQPRATDPLGSYAAQAGLSVSTSPLIDDVVESGVESDLSRLDASLLVRQLREEVAMLRADSGHLDLFDTYEATLEDMRRQNVALRARLQKAELRPELLRAIRSPQRGGSGARHSSPPPPPAKQQAHFRVLESSYRRVCEEHAALQASHAELQKQSRRFALQAKQCAALESRVVENAHIAHRREKESSVLRASLAEAESTNEELKGLVLELTEARNLEASQARSHTDQVTKLKREVATLTQALLEARATGALAQARAEATTTSTARSVLAPKRAAASVVSSKRSVAESLRLDELDDLETILLEGRRSDTPPSLVAIANRKGLELCSRLRTRLARHERDHRDTQDNEKALMMLVVKMQEKQKEAEARKLAR